MAEYEEEFVDEYDSYAYGGGGYEQDGDGYARHDGFAGYDQYHEPPRTAARIPDEVKKFILFFHQVVNDGNVLEIQKLYEVTYPRLSEDYYEKVPWPHERDIAALVDNDQVFLILYQEMYYRHIYARVTGGPSIEHRFESYYNYCRLFNYIISSTSASPLTGCKEPVALELPNQWLWEIVDEFLYQFQSFALYRTRTQTMSKDDVQLLHDNPKIWNVHSVLNVLHSMVDKSNINLQLKAYSTGGNAEEVAGEFGRRSLYKMLGYFSLVGLLRLHSLLADYHQAIKVLENIELNKKSLYSRVPACQITTYYFVGFAYMMMRRYADAIRTFSNILLYIQRTRQLFQAKNYQNDLINKQTDQMYTLLAVCLVLHPQRIDESVQAVLKEKPYLDKMTRMQHGDLKEFETCFSFACPKFLSPVPALYDVAPSENYHREPYLLQQKVFQDEVQQQILLPTIRSYLKLYTTMPLAKLAAFMDMSVEDFRTHLLCFKHKMRNVVWTKGTSGLDGELQSGSEVDFYIDNDMIHIADTKVAQRYGDFFIRQIHRFEELNRNISSLKV